MATTGNINPWSAGAVVFSTQPYAAFYERQMLRQQAKQDALENYFKDLGKNVTSAGMRSQDVPVLLQKNKDWQQFYMQNKAAILNPKLDNGQAYSQYMSGYQDQLGLTSESKNEAKKDQDLSKLRFNPEAKHIFDDPKFIEDKELDDLPIGDPRRKRFDLLTAALPPKPIGVKELDAYNKYLTGDIQFDKIPGKVENIGGFKTRTPIYTQYSPENQMKIGANAADAYDTDRTWRNEAVKFFNQITHDPIELDRYNKLYKSLYGSDIDTPREAWIAKGILDNNMKATEFKEGKDDFAMQKALMGMRQANAKELIRYKKEIDPNDKDMNDLWVTAYVGKLKDEAMGRQPLPYKYSSGATTQEYDIPVDPVLGKALSVGNVEPDAVRVDKDGKFRRIFYKRYQDGDADIPKGKVVGDIITGPGGKAAVDETLSRPQLTQDQIELALGKRALTGKQLNKQMVNTVTGGSAQSPNRKYNINGKTYSHDQLIKMYPEEKIKEYIEAGIIK